MGSEMCIRDSFFPRAAPEKIPSALAPPRLPVKLPVTLPASLVPPKLRSPTSMPVGNEVWRRGCMRCFFPRGCEAEEEMEGRLRGLGDDWYGGGDDILRGCSAVSYTHLRAHETDSYLVCRLLLEKKKYAVFCLKKKNSFFFFFFLMIRRQPRSTHCISSAASDVYKRQK